MEHRVQTVRSTPPTELVGSALGDIGPRAPPTLVAVGERHKLCRQDAPVLLLPADPLA